MENNLDAGDLLNQARQLRGKISSALTREMQEFKTSAVLGFLLSLGGFFTLGLLFYLILAAILVQLRIWSSGNLSWWLFFLFYTIVFVGLIFVGQMYKPKEDYYLGETWGGRVFDNPFTFRDDRDRRHMALGILLIVPNFVYFNLQNIVNFVRHGNPVHNPTLAAAILLMARERHSGQAILQTLHPIGFGKNSVTSALKFLDNAHWIELNQDETEAIFILATKGESILFDSGWLGKIKPDSKSPDQSSSQGNHSQNPSSV